MGLRFVRLLKAFRALRVVRTVGLFSELRVLLYTIYSSSRSLLTSMMLLGIMMLVYGILMCQFLQDVIRDETADYNLRMWAYKHYGSALRATYTMFELTMSGCWPQYVRVLIEQVSAG